MVENGATTSHVLVIGSGGAGVRAAIEAAGHGSVVLLSKTIAGKGGCTPMAEGGYNAVLREDDDFSLHAADTLKGGAFLNDPALVEVLVREAPERVREITRWLPPAPAGAGQPITNRAAWEALRHRSEWRELIPDAENLARVPIPALTDDLFMDFSRTGNRTRCQKVLSARDRRVSTFALAECLENQGRFVEPLVESIAAIARERTWVMPAHDGSLRNFKGETVDMD
ncbi:MAG TPA: FAD-binding protein, partial [Methanoregulaceae archaeon]|nr:FAD-binding protein [Methanoregulaceae archaeon]